MLHNHKLKFHIKYKVERLTKAEHDVEEHNESDSDTLHSKAVLAHPKRSRGNVLPSGEKVWRDRAGVRGARQNNERTCQICESRFAAESDGA